MSSLTYELVLAGLAVGSAAALTGIGLIVTYRATGVLNLAHGAVAMVCAYVLRQLVVEWGWPLPLAACVTLLVVAPGIGLVLDRAVFRPAAVLDLDPARTLVASIGVFVLLVGGAALLWGGGARADAPVLLGDDPWLQLAAVVLVGGSVGAVTRWTRLGRQLRAVVDNRELAALGGIDADRVSAAGWAFGSFTAGLTGVLLAPYLRLDPYGLPLLVVEVIAVAVVARMRSLPVAVVTALAIGIGQAQLTRFHPVGWAGPLVQAVATNLFVVALLVAALALPGVGARDALPRTSTAGARVPAGVWVVAGVLFLLPLGFAGPDLQTSVQVPALAVILLSLVVVTGRGGQISLGQAAYAGLGALFTALLAAGRFPGVPRLPELTALLVAVVLVAPLGVLTGWPAIRRHGLALALATLAVGVAASRFVFAQPYATAGLSLSRPAGFASDRRYYVLELVVLALALLYVAALRRGRTGRALAALRDHEAGAEAAGVPVPALKLLAFVAGAALAALGGGLLGMGVRAFDPEAYDPVRGLLWFAAVLVLGADSLLSPLAAAVLLVGLDAGARGGAAAAVIGLLAALTARLPPLTSLLPGTAKRPGAGMAGGRGGALRAARARAARPSSAGRPAQDGAPPRISPVRDRPPASREPRTYGTGPAGGRTPPAAADGGRPPTGRPAPDLPTRTGRDTSPAEGRAHPHRPAPAAAAAPAPTPAPTRTRGLEAHRLTLRYGGFTALDRVDLLVPPGGITALIGPNGAGKSSLFHCLAGTTRPTSGRVTLDGADITALPAHARTRLGIARTFQELAVFPTLTVEENVRVGAEQGRVRDDPRAVEQALRLLGLTGARLLPAAGLSTGTLRRVELARALAGRPHTLLLDEPAAGLDAGETAALARVLKALAADGTAVLVVEHDLDLVADIAHTVHVMEAGRIVS
ncbi:ATP-binding cassette domain-containing protein [Streptomyces ficellus]|uniref:ATP-binding cassette domain-containing protein n=1 Tax=Streptomyces ficellus TaxID=1977088 RepID=A0ABT7Z1U7_9ACTN|nr:ATP-binding cassette domain-containing protein [Streptomyces ficellus]MDN3293468.1 ATP-binding cassette domain-containing protein [Streptomyces ficellus]